jgi:hypothetical protein
MISWTEQRMRIMARIRSSDDAVIRNGRGRYPTGTLGGPGRASGACNELTEAFLHDLQEDWAQHGKHILEVMRQKHPEIYFQCMVKLALVQSTELEQPRPFGRQYTREEVRPARGPTSSLPCGSF